MVEEVLVWDNAIVDTEEAWGCTLVRVAVVEVVVVIAGAVAAQHFY